MPPNTNDRMNSGPFRKSLAHPPPVKRHNRPILLFVTVCCAKRRRLLDNHGAHQMLREIWTEATFWLVGRYVLMPDHIHFFCAPGGQPESISPVMNWVKYWKRLATQRWPQQEQTPLFQRDAFDRQLRVADAYAEKWEYVRQNPVRAGLVAHPDDWPYQGELNFLPW